MKAMPFPALFVIVIVGIALLSAIAVVPAGHVGVKDFFGNVSPDLLQPGMSLVNPLTRVHRMTIQSQELKETASVPSREGLSVSIEISLIYKLDPSKAVEVYKTVGVDFPTIIVEPQMRSAMREITAAYEAKALYSAERDQIAKEINDLFTRMTSARGIIAESTLLRKIELPDVVSKAIQVKLQREQESEQMKFVLQKETQEAERKRIEAQGIADFQKIVTLGISEPLLEWKGIEATEKLAASPNAKIVIIGNPKSGLPLVFSGDSLKGQ